ncbi:trichohyalin-like [Erpetoichthys calabaricus]|uniref:trichohyalin-like n=1 Tax=Erpetoichthys calabaricus TaxID=27687 RepID=UPI00109F81B1|nr:trichohyalin-like [Erpetoichthys calabaricus]
MLTAAELRRLWAASWPFGENDIEAVGAMCDQDNLKKAENERTWSPQSRPPPNCPEREDRAHRALVLKRAEDLMIERDEEIMRLNKLLLAAHCHAVQEDQKMLKKQMKRGEKAEERRLHNMMEEERIRAIKSEDEKKAIRRKRLIEIGKFQRQQMEEKKERALQEREQEKRFLEILKTQKQNAQIARIRREATERERWCKEWDRNEGGGGGDKDLRPSQTEPQFFSNFKKERRFMQDALAYEREKEERRKREELKLINDIRKQIKEEMAEALKERLDPKGREQRLRETSAKKIQNLKDSGLEDKYLNMVKRNLHYLPPL